MGIEKKLIYLFQGGGEKILLHYKNILMILNFMMERGNSNFQVLNLDKIFKK